MTSTFIELVMQNLSELLPWVVIFSYQGGVRWTLGQNPVALGPGFHWRLWWLHKIEVISVVDEFMELPEQSVKTKDDVLVCFRTSIGFRVVDVVKHFCEVEDFQDATQGIAMQHLAARVRDQQYADMDISALERSLKNTLTTRVKGWGTEIIAIGFTDFAKARVTIRHFGNLFAQ